jgi:hypothetical protein
MADLVISEHERGEMKMADKIVVKGILPSMAYSNLKDAPDEEQVFSTHVLTWRGLQNAIKSARALHADYTKTHGNGAAHQIRISAVGFVGHPDFWQGVYNSSSCQSLTHESVAGYNKWLDAFKAEQDARDAEEDRKRDARWTRDEQGNWIER